MLFALAIRVYQLTNSNAAVSGLFLTFGIPSVLFGIAAGVIVDHFDKRQILMTCDALRAFLVLMFLFHTRSIAYIYLFSTVNATITQFYIPSQAPMIPRIVKKSQLIAANSLFSFTFYTSLAVGSIFAGPLLRVLGSAGIFFLISCFFLLASYNAYQLPRQDSGVRSIFSPRIPSPGRIFSRAVNDVRDGVGYILRSRFLSDAILLLTGTQIILMLLGTLGPGFADRLLRIDVHDSSLVVLGPVVAGIVVGALWVGSIGERRTSSSLIQAGVSSAGLLLILISLTVQFHSRFVFLLLFLLGVANSLLDVPANSMLQRYSDERIRGRVYGMLTAAIGGVGIMPVIIGGVLADAIGIGKVIFLLGVTVSLYGMYRLANVGKADLISFPVDKVVEERGKAS